ncbi:hypothetical protein [Paenibacillus aceris]|uniref:Uncharacterized protein n=1 Tax=Paenibacillus aceris TaxID=869555 RepID=A0ABS4HSG4_9BACL|nr:hypothetical protein [Paenibacillus aceris]MBP1961460.1 hypothetical protein [Paenibacillus aceris]NHW37761.1 hypothetical protein [Paenibacillus aceris]
MEQLIAFLFKHWYLVIIGLTLLYQIQNKGRRASQKAPGRGMLSFGEAPGQAQRRPEAGKLEQKGLGSPQSSGGIRDELSRPNAMQSSASGPKAKSSPFSSSKQANAESSSVYAGDLTAASHFPESPSQEQVLQGVVWAEILGPPRSKKPYRR